MTDSPTSQAMHLAMTELKEREQRIAVLEDVLRAFNLKEEWILSGTADTLTLRIPIAVIQKAAAVLNKETNRG